MRPLTWKTKAMAAAMLLRAASAPATVVFATDFDDGLRAEIASPESVQEFDGSAIPATRSPEASSATRTPSSSTRSSP